MSRGSLGTHEQGLDHYNQRLHAGARKEAARSDATPVGLMSGEQLDLLLIENGFGVHHFTPDLFELDEEFAAGEGKE